MKRKLCCMVNPNWVCHTCKIVACGDCSDTSFIYGFAKYQDRINISYGTIICKKCNTAAYGSKMTTNQIITKDDDEKNKESY